MPRRDSEPGASSSLAEFLRRRQDDILAAWQQAIQVLPKARVLSPEALIDHLPALLDKLAAMADELASGQVPSRPSAQAERHAQHRLDEGLDLVEVVIEYALLRRAIIQLWENELKDSAPTGMRLLNQAIDTAIGESVDRYTEAQSRTLRALDRISTAALESKTLDELLDRLLRVFLETTAAVDTAAILLREDDDVLRVRAGVGLEEEVTQGFSLRMGEGFSGTIATERRPIALRTAAGDPLVKSKLIHTKGLRALYGVPLIDRDRVIGVAHMGSCTAFELSKQDQQLFRAMTQRATIAISQHAMRDQVSRVAEILELGDACVVLDRRWRVTFVNENQERMSRLPRTETLGRLFWDIWPEIAHPDSKYWSELHRAMNERVSVEFDEHYAPLDTWAAVSVHPTRDGGIAVFFREASERKRAEEAAAMAHAEAEAAQQRWRSLFQQAPLRSPCCPAPSWCSSSSTPPTTPCSAAATWSGARRARSSPDP